MGHMFSEAVKVRESLKREGYSCTLVNGRFVKPLDGACITKLAENHKLIAVMEENVLTGDLAGVQVLSFAGEQSLDVKYCRWHFLTIM